VKKTSRRSPASPLSPPLLRRLNAYFLAAGAEQSRIRLDLQSVAIGVAALGGLGLALPAHAEVIYKPVHVSIQPGNWYYLNPVGAQVAPFLFAVGFTSPGIYWDTVSFNPGTSRAAVVVNRTSWSVAQLPQEAAIGPNRRFGASRGLVATFGPYGGGTFKHHVGFRFEKIGYMGFKFAVNGQEHYGWARVLVTFNTKVPKRRLSAVMDGYAYETIPNRPIRAGQMKEDTAPSGIPETMIPAQSGVFSAVSHQPTSSAGMFLGLLALGHEGIEVWRREKREAGSDGM
jgi:hypothetical protein